MFRCVARLRTQQPDIQWHAAFAYDVPTHEHITREIRRFGCDHAIIIPWTLQRTSWYIPDDIAIRTDITAALGTHPLLRDIFMQRANEAHYLRHTTTYHQQAIHIIFVGYATSVVHGVAHHLLDTLLVEVDQLSADAILQPLILSQTDPLMHQLTQQTARGMPLERFGVGRALEYDRRLLHVITDIVAQYR